MIISDTTVESCSICLQPLGFTFEDKDEFGKVKVFVTSTLHESEIGATHKIHQVCVHQWFRTQLENEPIGTIDPYDLDNIPFSCPLCKKKLSLIDAENAAGVNLAEEIELTRICRNESLFEPKNRVICNLF